MQILLYCADKTETKAVAAVAGVAVVPAVHLTAAGRVVPAAAAATAEVAVVRVDIPAPLPNVTAHVIKSVTVCLFLRCRV